ncbi:protein DA1-related 1-like isoform X2 [Primulina eburnea]|uniref:protein DA1-related 1-like isoform X2 n=1 Tax=Primulina eburnea TaxID=1245227 RepID=UPI003C6C2242
MRLTFDWNSSSSNYCSSNLDRLRVNVLYAMGWLTKIFKGSNHKILGGQYRGSYEDDTIWEDPTTSEVFVTLSLLIIAGFDSFPALETENFHNESDLQETRPDFDREEIDRAIALSIAEVDEKEKKTIDKESHLEEDEQLAKAIQESLNVESPTQSPPRAPPTRPPVYDHGSLFPHNIFRYPLGRRICSGCKSEIGNDRFFSGMGAFWHPECFRCYACNQPISDHEFSMSDGRPYHKSCYKDLYHPKCDVCKQFIPSNASGEIAYREHPFWHQKYCPSHENDGTPRCCSCERMEQVDCRYLILDDGRKLCLECLDSSIMDTHECQPLYLEIQEFYEGLNMKVEQQIPMLLVERQALNEAMEGEKIGHHHMPETRGLCLSEEQTIRTILRRPRIGGYRIIDMFTEPYRLIRRCEVTAILVLFGLPRLMTGSILAHEMMHAWLRLKGYPSLSPDVEEGICQVLAHMWLDSEIIPGLSNDEPSTSTSSSLPSGSSKKGKRSQFEKKLGGFFKDQIESNPSVAYGDGFRQGNKAVLEFGLKRTLDHIRLTGSFPC